MASVSDLAAGHRNVRDRVRIGISGWRYEPWRGAFYPEKLTQKKELAYASGIFNSIEINGTFYSLSRPENFASWAAETPADFVFSVKGPRFITHIRRLKEAEGPVANFFASGILRLGAKLGPILWQLPPNFLFDAKRIEIFFKLLPHDSESAARVAGGHDKWMNGRSWLKVDENRPIRHAMEVRHASFVTPEFVELLREHDVALVCADTPEWPRKMDVTSDFMYLRLHGSETLYASGYTAAALDEWAARIAAWVQGNEPADAERIVDSAGKTLPGRDVWIYFDNDMKVKAPVNARELMARMDALLGPGSAPAASSVEAPAGETPGVQAGVQSKAAPKAPRKKPGEKPAKKSRKGGTRANARKKL
jgi:uncharacterized protein YecE (DUF72 family)